MSPASHPFLKVKKKKTRSKHKTYKNNRRSEEKRTHCLGSIISNKSEVNFRKFFLYRRRTEQKK